MSTSREQIRTDDRVIHTISRWLARHADDDELRAELDAVDIAELSPEQAEAVDELREELRHGSERAATEMVARETIEAVALG